MTFEHALSNYNSYTSLNAFFILHKHLKHKLLCQNSRGWPLDLTLQFTSLGVVAELPRAVTSGQSMWPVFVASGYVQVPTVTLEP